MDGQVGDFTGDIPERHIHCADRTSIGVAVRTPEVLPDCANIQWIAADHYRLQSLEDLIRELIGPGARGTKERVAVDAFVGRDADDADVGETTAKRIAVGGARNLPAVEDDGQVRDVHQCAAYSTLRRQPTWSNLTSDGGTSCTLKTRS